MKIGLMTLAVLLVAAGTALGHWPGNGEPGHWGVRNGTKVWHSHQPSQEKREELRRKSCENVKAWGRRKAKDWNWREGKAYARLQKECADQSPVGKAGCAYETRMYNANYSPAKAAEFQKRVQRKIAKSCAPRKNPLCENIAKQIEKERRKGGSWAAKNIASYRKQAARAGCG